MAIPPSRESVSQEIQTDLDVVPPPVTTPPAHNELEKDVFYYRNVNKELKSKLREVVAVNHRLAKTLQEQSQSLGPSPAV